MKLPWQQDVVVAYCSRGCCFFDSHGRLFGKEALGRWWRPMRGDKVT
jgi:hypothetical protein